MQLEERTGMECCSGHCGSCYDRDSSSVSSNGPNDKLSPRDGTSCELDDSIEIQFQMWSTWCLSILPSCNFIMYVKGPRISSTIPSSHLDPLPKFSTNTVSLIWNFWSLEWMSWLSCCWICRACTVSSMFGFNKSRWHLNGLLNIMTAGEIPVVDWGVL